MSLRKRWGFGRTERNGDPCFFLRLGERVAIAYWPSVGGERTKAVTIETQRWFHTFCFGASHRERGTNDPPGIG